MIIYCVSFLTVGEEKLHKILDYMHLHKYLYVYLNVAEHTLPNVGIIEKLYGRK